MLMLCSKCGARFESLIVDRDLAFKEIMGVSMKHVQHRHKDMFNEMGKSMAICMAALSNFMHLSEFCIVPEEEEKIQDNMEQMQELVMVGIGFDPEEDEEDDNEGDEEEGEQIQGPVLPGAGDPDTEEETLAKS